MRVLFAGGGTGGHINPALAIASIIQAHDPEAEFLFAGTPNGMEARLVPQSGYQLATIEVAGFQRKISLNNIKRNAQALYYLAKSGKRARQIVADFKPDIAIGTGGYVAGPVIRMAAKMGVPCAIHEQNAFPGVTNKMLSQNVDHVMLTVKEALDYMEFDCPYTVTGLPVRSGISRKTKEEARRELGFDDNLCILSFGGSLGAGCINEVMEELIPWHVRQGLKINHIHGYGGMGRDTFPAAMEEAGIPMRSKRLRITEYINDMDTCLAAADLVICRAGASTLAELEAAGKASILIPSPIVAGNHQLHNANVLGKAGAAIVIEQKNVTVKSMINHVKTLYENPEKLTAMSRKAASLQITDTPDRIWEIVQELLKKGEERRIRQEQKASGQKEEKKKLTFKETMEKAKDGVMSCVPQLLPDKEPSSAAKQQPKTGEQESAENTEKQ
ncbi:MAG: undecaprenyldiphospho-muramoylpentapeptide beta-N-acetylglucosaminyltransferase [Ruminococcus sp.]|nr:undecaprenyldiphospho-muramoylpentapeptide beta-N-acetylglucosaminyltransferase [Ruminococcus sp.]